MTHPLFFNEAYYQNIRHNQIDWAALAQNWIRLRPEAPPPYAQAFPPGPPAPLPPQQQWPNAAPRAPRSLLGPGPSISPMMTMSGPPPPRQFQAENFGGNFEPSRANLWRRPPPPQSVEFGGFPTVRPPQPLCSLPPMQAPQRASPPPPPARAAPVALGAPPPPPLFAGVDTGQMPSDGEEKVPPWVRSGKTTDESNTDAQAAPVQIGAEQRKRLPAWIREGLERMEREKREREEKERKEREATQRIELSPVRERADGKSKFESDSESEPEQNDRSQHRSSLRSPTPLADYALPPSPESFKRDANMLLKQWMTELLLGVCDNLINKECSQTFQKAQRRGGDDDSDNASSGDEDSDEEKSTVKKSRWNDSESSRSVGVFKTPAVPSPHRKSESNFAETAGTSSDKERTSRRHFEEASSEEKYERESRRHSSDKSPKHERRRSRDRSPRDDRHRRRHHSRSPERHRSERRRRRSRSRSPRRSMR